MKSGAAETAHLPVNEIATGHFDNGPQYATTRRQGTPDWLLIYTVSGHGRFGVKNGEIISNSGDVVLIKPHSQHDYGTAHGHAGWELLWAHFYPRPSWLEWLDWPLEPPGHLRLTLHDPVIRQKVSQRLEDCNRLALGPWRRRETLAMNALEEVLLWCDLENPRSTQSTFDARIRDAMDYICQQIAQPLTLEDIADHAGLSSSRLSHLFKEQTGTTPQQFLEKQRMERAVQLLEMTQLSIKEIAQRVGFESPSYFTLRFKKHAGKSPKAYREGME